MEEKQASEVAGCVQYKSMFKGRPYGQRDRGAQAVCLLFLLKMASLIPW